MNKKPKQALRPTSKHPRHTTKHCSCTDCSVLIYDTDMDNSQLTWDNTHYADASETNLNIQKQEHTRATGHTQYTRTITRELYLKNPNPKQTTGEKQ